MCPCPPTLPPLGLPWQVARQQDEQDEQAERANRVEKPPKSERAVQDDRWPEQPRAAQSPIAATLPAILLFNLLLSEWDRARSRLAGDETSSGESFTRTHVNSYLNAIWQEENSLKRAF